MRLVALIFAGVLALAVANAEEATPPAESSAATADAPAKPAKTAKKKVEKPAKIEKTIVSLGATI